MLEKISDKYILVGGLLNHQRTQGLQIILGN